MAEIRRPREDDIATRFILTAENLNDHQKVEELQGLGWLCEEIDGLMGFAPGTAKAKTLRRWQNQREANRYQEDREAYKH